VRAQTYEITFLGQASTTLRAEFDDCEVIIGPGTTTLRAELSDRAALSGLMERINSLGLDVIDVSLAAQPAGQLPGTAGGGPMFRLAQGLSPASSRHQWLARDLVAGIVLSTLLVPQGMAYAELAGLPPITGLYTSILCLLGYAVFGPSRILVLGPDSSLGPMIAATILPLVGADGSPERAIALASMLAIIVGAIMIVGAVAKLGFIAGRTG